MKLISESISSPIVCEKVDDSNDLFISGIFLQAEQKNRNGRIYPLSILESQVNKYKSEFVDTKRAIGELNHPPSPTINPERASHIITELKRNGNDFMGKAKILNTPQGQIVRGLLEGGVSLGVSSRGLGSLKEGTGVNRGTKMIQNDYKLLTVDVVSNPSAPEAFVEGVYESVEYMIESGQIKEYFPETTISIRKTLHESTKSRLSNDQRAILLIDLISKLK